MANLTVQQPTQTPNPTINVDPNQVSQANQGANQTPNQGQQPAWWEKLLPTAGGVLGGIVGGLIPGLGETGVGEVGGAAAGGAVGQKLENFLTGQKQSTLAAGAENAIGQGAGMAVGLGGKALLGAIAPKAADVASSTLQSQFKSPIDKSVVDYFNASGVNDARQIGKATPIITGPNGAYNNMVRNTLQQVGENGTKVNITNLDKQLGNLLAGENGTGATILNNSQKNNVNDLVQRTLSRLQPETSGLATNKTTAEGAQAQLFSTPDKTYEAFTNLRDAANAAYQGKGAITGTPQNATANVLSKMASYLKDQSFVPDGINSIPLTDEMKSTLISNIDSLKEINPGLHASEIKNITNATKLSDLNDMQSNWVQASKALQKGAITGSTKVGTTASDIAAGLAPISFSHPLMTLAGLAMKSPTGDRVGTSVLSNLGSTFSKGSKDQATTGVLKSLGITNKNAGLVNKITPLATRATALSAANLPNIASSGQPSTLNQVTQGANMQGTQGAGGAGAPGQDALNQLYNQLLQQEQLSFGGTQTGSLIGALNQLAPQVNKQQIAANAIQQLMPAYQNAGGAQGLGGGLLSQLSGLIRGTAANVYGNQQQATAGVLGNALGISPDQASKLTPQLMSNQQTANPQITALQNLLSMYGGGQAAPVGQ
jgi:hypothetical protein